MIDFLQMMTAGKQVEHEGEVFVLLGNTGMRMPDGRALFTAVRGNDPFPAQVFLIPGMADVHLSGQKSDAEDPADEEGAE